MNTQTYRAPSMPEALQKAQVDLGDDAIVLSARRVLDSPAWQVWNRPEYEIVASPPRNGRGPNGAAGKTLARDVAAVHAALAQVIRQIDPVQANWPDALRAVYRRLIDQDVNRRLVGETAALAMETLSPRALDDPRRVRGFFTQELSSRIVIGGQIPLAREPIVIVLVGPSGSGKTMAAARLAGFAQFTLQRRTTLITLDTYGIGALSQIRALAEFIGFRLDVAYTPAELQSVLDDLDQPDVLLVDTPARNPYRPEELAELEQLLAPLPAAHSVYLVVSATSKAADLGRAAAAFRPLNPTGLLFTHLDETDMYGNLFSLGNETRWPIAYTCASPAATNGIEPASAKRLVGLLLGDE